MFSYILFSSQEATTWNIYTFQDQESGASLLMFHCKDCAIQLTNGKIKQGKATENLSFNFKAS